MQENTVHKRNTVPKTANAIGIEVTVILVKIIKIQINFQKIPAVKNIENINVL